MHIDENEFEIALELLGKAKAAQVKYLNLDYLRAKAFCGLHMLPTGSKALKEKLRYFPDNSAARNQVATEGLIQIADYGHWEGCPKAVREFGHTRIIASNPNKIDYTGVWLKKQPSDLAAATSCSDIAYLQ